MPKPACHSEIRRARPQEASALSELAFRSKGHWGYDAAFLETCRGDLTITAEEIATAAVYVLVRADGIAGFYTLKPVNNGAAELDDLFVDPTAIGTGVGRRLWQHAIDMATELGHSELLIQSDPYAEGFYLAMGAERIGERESTVAPGRMLPLLRYRI
jgi:GNAT superfamily N-acetyltransferase